MFENAGGKLKGLSIIIFIFSIIIGVVLGYYIDKSLNTKGMVVFGLIVGGITGWLSSIILYAFGELCENVAKIAGTNTVNTSTPNKVTKKKTDKKTPNDWYCPHCGNLVPGKDQICPKCNYKR